MSERWLPEGIGAQPLEVDGPWLAVDTATDAMGVALWDVTGLVDERRWLTRRQHTRELAPAVDVLLARHDVSADGLAGVAVALGPGSYTGLRIGLAFAKGLASATGAAVVGVPTLDIVAAPYSPPWIDRQAVLWAVIQAGRGRLAALPYGPDGRRPEPGTVRPGPLADLLARTGEGDWIVGELSDEERSQAAAAGLRVLPAAAARRAGWLAYLALRGVGVRAEAQEELAELVPYYPSSGNG